MVLAVWVAMFMAAGHVHGYELSDMDAALDAQKSAFDSYLASDANAFHEFEERKAAARASPTDDMETLAHTLLGKVRVPLAVPTSGYLMGICYFRGWGFF